MVIPESSIIPVKGFIPKWDLKVIPLNVVIPVKGWPIW